MEKVLKSSELHCLWLGSLHGGHLWPQELSQGHHQGLLTAVESRDIRHLM